MKTYKVKVNLEIEVDANNLEHLKERVSSLVSRTESRLNYGPNMTPRLEKSDDVNVIKFTWVRL